MENRKRNLVFYFRLTKEERELIKTVANLKGMTMTDMIIELVKKEYEKIEMEEK